MLRWSRWWRPSSASPASRFFRAVLIPDDIIFSDGVAELPARGEIVNSDPAYAD
jgi:hypothetical protein